MTTQTIQIHTFDYGASLSSATLRSIADDTLVATADSVNEVTSDSGLYAAVFGEASVIAAGTYRLRAVISGQPINRYVTLAGTDNEVVQARSERLAELDSAVRVKLHGTQDDYAPLKASDYTAPANSDVAAIKAKTDNLPSDPADQSLLVDATNTVLTRLGSPAGASMSADIAAVKTDTGTTIPGLFTTLTTKIRKFFQLGYRKDAAIATDNAAELTELNANGGSGGGAYSNVTDALESIRDRGDAAWTTGGGGGGGDSAATMLSTTIATVTSQTVLVLTAGSADNDVYNDQLVVITDAVTSTQKARMLVSDYVGSTKTLTLASAPGFTVAAGDSIAIIAVAGLTNGQKNQLALIGAGTRMTVKADLGTSIALKIGDTYAASRSTAKRIDVNDSDSSIYDMLTGAEIASIDFGLANASTVDVVTGTVDPETIEHTAASGSVSAYTTVYVDVDVDKSLKPFCGDYDIQITYEDETRRTAFSGKCDLVRDFKA
jgi:hypothetical protein